MQQLKLCDLWESPTGYSVCDTKSLGINDCFFDWKHSDLMNPLVKWKNIYIITNCPLRKYIWKFILRQLLFIEKEERKVCFTTIG